MELPQLHDGRTERPLQESSPSHLHLPAAGHRNLRARQHGIRGRADSPADSVLGCNCCDLRPEGDGLGRLRDAHPGGHLRLRRPLRPHHDVVADVLRRRPERPHAGDPVAHQREPVHADAVAGVSVHSVPVLPVHQRRVRAHHLQQHRRVVLHHAFR
uniref:(northern house mosquito) hypothetical protein n=1 Tax=Culex pipiens TaxID=7175 RepID=A0A8D8GRN8_CULPI